MGWVSFEELLDDIIALDTAHTLLQDKQSYVGIHDQSQLNAEVERIYPYLKDLCGIYADIPGKATFQGGLEEKIWARLGGKGRSFNADPSSYHIGIGKLVKQTGIATARLHSKLRSPDRDARKAIFKIHLRGRPLEKDIDGDELLDMTEGLSGADVRAFCERAADIPLREHFKTGKMRPIAMQDFTTANEKHQSIVNQWFTKASHILKARDSTEAFPELADHLIKVEEMAS